MAKFAYKVRNDQGVLQSGTMDGSSVDDCIHRLEEKSLIPLVVEELNFDGTRKDLTLFDKINDWLTKSTSKVPFKAVTFFTRQLATLINGGVALPKAMEQLGKNERSNLKEKIAQISEDLSTGTTFSDALSKHPGVFSHMFVSVVRAGEMAGALDQVLNELADYMENVEMMKAKVKAAMRYPAIIGAFVGVVIVAVLVFLVPVFADMYAGFGAQLPAPTLIMIAMSEAIRYNAVLVVLSIAGFAAFVAILFLSSEKTKYYFDRFILLAPVFGEIARKNLLAIYCRTMSLLLNAGTPILEATQIASAAVNNKFYAAALEGVYNDIKQGELLSTSLVNAKEFPPLVTQLVATGEESGKIDELLRKAAGFYDREIRNIVDSIASIIEPILIVVLGTIVGGMLIGLYMPIFMMGQIIN